MALSLPSKRKGGDKDPKKLTGFLYGPPKVGKTDFVYQMGEVFFLASEKRHAQFNAYVRNPKNWEQFKTYVKMLEKDCSAYDIVCIDTVGNFYEMCFAHICKKHEMDHPKELDFGEGWGYIKKEFKKWMLRLVDLPIGVWFISHSDQEHIRTPLGELEGVKPLLTGQCREVVLPLVDQILYLGIERYKKKVEVKDKNGKKIIKKKSYNMRTMVCDATPEIEAGDTYSVLPPVFKCGNSAKEGYVKYLSYFNKQKS